MIQKALTYILLAILITNMMAYQCVYLCFKAQQSYIVANLCVKKDVKANDCQGQCHLKKMVKKTEAASQQVLKELKMDFICQLLPIFTLKLYYKTLTIHKSSQYNATIIEGYLSNIYSPPDYDFSA